MSHYTPSLSVAQVVSRVASRRLYRTRTSTYRRALFGLVGLRVAS